MLREGGCCGRDRIIVERGERSALHIIPFPPSSFKYTLSLVCVPEVCAEGGDGMCERGGRGKEEGRAEGRERFATEKTADTSSTRPGVITSGRRDA